FKENQIDDPETLAIYQKRIMVGKFLLENEIEYDYLSFKVTDNELNFFSSELFDGVTIFGMFASIILIVLMIVFSIMTLNHDSSIGVARLLFALGKTRKQILKEKYSAYITVLGLVSITFIFIISIVVIPFNTTFEKVLIVDAYNVYMIDINLYLAICCFSLLLFVLFFSTIVFAISMSIRGVYSAIFINVLFSAGYLLAMSNSQGIIASFINEIISYNVGSTNLVIYIVLYLVRLLLGVGFFLIARIRFLKRDIV
ncbi:MAG: hypothetical protein LBF12_00745, partial [Christensenellaceae bacterium]|nr:hypothetical protein [Christensenellaceae bacterium]